MLHVDHPQVQHGAEESIWLRTRVRAFTQVVQDKQFSALGLVLVAELARVCRLIGIVDDDKAAGGEFVVEEEDEAPLREQQRAVVVVERPGFFRLPDDDDVGEVVERMPETKGLLGDDERVEKTGESAVAVDSAFEHNTMMRGPAAAAKSITRASSEHKKKSSGKVKKGNAIDDLFRGLG